MQKNAQKNKKLLLISIVVVSTLLLVNLLLLFIVNGKGTASSEANGNIIGQEQTTTAFLPSGRLAYLRATPAHMMPLSAKNEEALSLSFWNGYNGKKTFEMANMLPGDSDTKEYTVTVKSKDAVSLTFDAEIKQNSLLSKGLIFTVEVNGDPIYQGSLAAMPDLTTPLKGGVASENVVYKIRAELPTSAGNEYAGLTLSVTFHWSLAENRPAETTSPGGGGGGGGGGIDWPELPDETTTVPEETTKAPEETTSPPETEPDPPETEPDPPETEPQPPETEPDPPETEPKPPETEPEPPETGHVTPQVPETCKTCLIDRWIESIFGDNGDRCIICDFVVAIFHPSTSLCICPIGCLIVVLLCLLIIILTIILILYIILRKREKDEEEEDENEDLGENEGNHENKQE